jgi:hypothetical protein
MMSPVTAAGKKMAIGSAVGATVGTSVAGTAVAAGTSVAAGASVAAATGAPHALSSMLAMISVAKTKIKFLRISFLSLRMSWFRSTSFDEITGNTFSRFEQWVLLRLVLFPRLLRLVPFPRLLRNFAIGMLMTMEELFNN